MRRSSDETTMDVVRTEFELLLRVLLAAVLDGAIGYDRQLRLKPARIVRKCSSPAAPCAPSAILTLGEAATVELRADAVRVPAAIVTGVGFLDAGAIMRAGTRITRLTTAAGIWVVAAVGLLSAAGFFVLAIGATVLVLLVVKSRPCWTSVGSMRPIAPTTTTAELGVCERSGSRSVRQP